MRAFFAIVECVVQMKRRSRSDLKEQISLSFVIDHSCYASEIQKWKTKLT
jgi:hypothetical protein